jgi:hypothetical protein
MNPGRYNNLSLERYHAEEGWSKTKLDYVDRSMLHYYEYCNSGGGDLKCLIDGAAFHCSLLTPKLFEAEYVSLPKIDKRTKVGKEEFARLSIENVGKTMLDPGTMEMLEGMSEAFWNHPTAPKILEGGAAENSFLWVDNRTELLLKCRPDYLRSDGVVVELKTTVDASWFKFQRDIYKYRYHVQAAMCCDGISKVLETPINEFIIIAIEKDPPYAIAIYRLDSMAIETGRAAYRKNLDTIKCYNCNEYAGYPTHIQDMWLPGYAE